jgi:hypothetical protein
VRTPKIGSRDGVLSFGGIWRIYADLRRESFWGNLKMGFFEVLSGSPRVLTEEGGQQCVWGNF